jgi:signal transduction histidine kinase
MTGRRAPHARRPALVVPAACGALSLALLVMSVGVATSDPASVRGVPGLDDPAWWWSAAVLVAQAVVLGALWARPRAALLAAAAGLPLLVTLGDAIGVGLTAVVVGTCRAVVARPPRPLVPALLGAGTLVAAGVAAAGIRTGNGWWPALGAGVLQGVAAVGIPFVLASLYAARRDAVTALAEAAEAEVRARDALVRVAVERERTSMARELHDIAAHHLSGIAVMTGAIGRQIDTDPEGAKQAVAQVREQSTAMLRDLRNLVVLLRDTDALADPAAAVRVETLAGVAGLVDRAREAGADVTLERAGPVDEVAASGAVGPLAQLAAYRVVQEALANAARHAPGARCTVRVDASDGHRVRVLVRNDAPARPEPAGGPPGYGLVGMRERAELTGATLRYGPTDDGGWQVALEVPVTTDAGEGR